MYTPSPEDTALHPLTRPPAQRTPEARRGVRTLITQVFFVALAVANLAVALLFLLLPDAGAAQPRLWSALLFGGIAAVSAGAAHRLREQRGGVELTMFAVLALATVAIAASAWLLGWGVLAPTLGAYALFVCVLCAGATRRLGLLLGTLCGLNLLALALLAPTRGSAPTLTALSTQLVLLAAGLASGLLIAYVVQRYVRSADDRERRFRELLAIAADAYWEVDGDYRLRAASRQRNEGEGLTLEEGIGQLPWDLPQFRCDAETLDALLADLDSRVAFHERPVRWLARDGTLRDYRISGEPRFDERGVFTGYWGVARDVSADIAARQALLATETRYHALFDRIPTPLIIHEDGRVLDANPAALAMFGFDDVDTIRGQDLLAAFERGDSRERARRRMDQLVELAPGAALPVADFRLHVRDGRRLAVRATGVRVGADDDMLTLSIFVDDTERRQAEEAVRRSEALLSHLVATSPDVITLTDLATGRYAMVNRTFERVTGYSVAEVVGRTSLELGIWAEPQDRERFIDEVRTRGRVSDMPTAFVAKDGRRVAMLIAGARFAMDRREYLVINARDVSEIERNRLEREAILDNASIGIAVTRDQRFVLANPAFERMFGWAPGTLAGQPGRAVWGSDEAYEEIGKLAWPMLSAGEQLEAEREMTRHDGSRFTARMLVKAVDPRHPAKGGTVWLIEDITERRQFERALADARDAAEAASRAKSAFLANTSHELRTPLNGMIGLARLARGPALSEALRTQYLDQIADSAQSLADIISDILDLSKIEAGKLALESMPFDLGELLRGMRRAYSTLADTRGLALRLEIGPGADGVVVGDPLRVRQVLSNYLSNAIKFTAAGEVRVFAERVAGDRMRLQVSDTGPGIDAGTQSRLFRPFTQADESTTRRFGGTGLGLSICRELAVLMRGEVGVVSRPGHGATFWAELPLPAGEPLPPLPAAGADAGDLRGTRVLMVEDNTVNMMIAVALLESWGVAVEQAHDGLQAVDAVQRAERAGRPFDAVLMDVQMPVMSGYEATRALRAIGARGAGEDRRLPIIALTAAALVTEREAALDAGMDDFLTKPIVEQRLHERLRFWVRRRGD